jgi:hypothetical protein
VLLAVAAPSLAVRDATASPIEVHQEITEPVLRDMGWRSSRAIDGVIDANVATDLARLSLVTRSTTTMMFPDAGEWVPAVGEMAETASFSHRASVGFHFNSLYSFQDIEARWEEFGAWVDASVARLIPEGDEPLDMESMLVLIGLVTHAVQDFYAHANWTTILNQYTAGDFDAEELPLWEELIHDHEGWREHHPDFPLEEALAHLRISDISLSTDDDEGGLQSGSTRWEDFEGPRPWGHRHRHGDEQEAIHQLAARATRLWVTRIESQLPFLPWRYQARIVASAPVPPEDLSSD